MFAAIRRSLRNKIMAVILAATLAALLVSVVSLLAYESHNYREFVSSDLATQARILARINAPALQFDDPDAARVNLSLLEHRNDVLSAAVYAADGDLFATYVQAGASASFPAVTEFDRVAINGNVLTVVYPIVESGNTLGAVYLEVRYALGERLLGYLLILGGVLLISLLAAALVSLALQRTVTAPILAVANAARRVVKERDFTTRAEKTSDDEIGDLVDAFNSMLAEVGRRQRALEESNTKLKRESDERRNAEQALRIADRRKDEFLAMLAHELRNPLAPIVSSLEILDASGDPAVRQRAHTIIDRQVAHMVRLIEDLLDVSRITRGKLTLRKERVELGDIVQNASDAVRPLVAQRRQALSVDIPEQPVYLNADAVRLSQILSNLLNNAVKYSEEGGRIGLTGKLEGRLIRIEVTDDGLGIGADQLAEIFEPFAQVDTQPDQVRTGLGLGLALAKRLAELHGGSIEAASDGVGRGSRFTVSLPVLDSSERPANAGIPPYPRTATASGCRILVVDDNADYAASLEFLLRSQGHEVHIAHDALSALASAKESAPDVAFLDIGLPGISGYELAERLRDMLESIVIVAVSGWGPEQDSQQPSAAAFDARLIKPVKLEDIIAALDTLALGGAGSMAVQ